MHLSCLVVILARVAGKVVRK